MINFVKEPHERWIELGCGENPHPRCDIHCDIRPGPHIDFAVDLNEPLPIKDEDFDGVLSIYAFEHVLWRKQRQLIKEVFRILRPEGRLILVLPNTEKQLRWVLDNGWKNRPKREGMEDFEEASCVLFGDSDYPENTHKSYFSPTLIQSLLSQAGFVNTAVINFGAEGTDMVVESIKPKLESRDIYRMVSEIEASSVTTESLVIDSTTTAVPTTEIASTPTHHVETTTTVEATPAEQWIGLGHSKRYVRRGEDGTLEESDFANGPFTKMATPAVMLEQPPVAKSSGPPHHTTEERAALFDRLYFEGTSPIGGYAGGGYRDFACHMVTAQHILKRKPGSVVELGPSRGYVLKRIQDAGVPAEGIDISKHCYLTRVCNGIHIQDLCITPWKTRQNRFDLSFSCGVLDHIPEKYLSEVLEELKRISSRGLHGVTFGENQDKTRLTNRSQEWWEDLFSEHGMSLPSWEIVEKDSLEQGSYKPEWFQDKDKKIKLNVGSFTTMFYHGWKNLDIVDLSQFAQSNRYDFQKCDIRQGLPFKTTEVDMIFSCHCLEHLTYDEGLRLFREFRRVIKPGGFVRVIVPDTYKLAGLYSDEKHPRENQSFGEGLKLFDHLNEGCVNSPTLAGKLYSILCAGDHKALYDAETMIDLFQRAGFTAVEKEFRQSDCAQLLIETQDMLPEISLFVEARPRIDS